jgi:hypothetical protein
VRQGIEHQSRTFVVAHLAFTEQHNQRSAQPSHTACNFEFKPPLVRPIRLGTAPFLQGWRRCGASLDGSH